MIGQRWPGLNSQYDIFTEMSGVPDMAYRYFSLEPGGQYPPSINKIADEYLLVIARANDLPDDAAHSKWLMDRKPEVKAAIRADLMARIKQTPLPRNAYLHMVAEHVADYKRRHELLDRADFIHGRYRTNPHIKLLMLDEIHADDLPLLIRYFPNASVIMTSREPHDADIGVYLPVNLRQPQRDEFRHGNPEPSQVPAPPHFQSMFIMTATWRVGKWMAWLKQHGFPPPRWPHWQTAVAAWKLDQGRACASRLINPLLLAGGLEPELDSPFVHQGDTEGWTNWRDMLDQFDPAVREHADAVIERYGRLFPLPIVMMGVPERMRQCEAEVVIIDNIQEKARRLAESRATGRLIVLNKSRFLATSP